MIKISSSGDFSKTFKFLEKMQKFKIERILQKYGSKGVSALSSATPIDSGLTASSWTYSIEISGESATIHWLNNNTNNGVNIAVILQYGHGTGTGGYVEGRDYINPALQPIFDRMVEEAWREVVNA